ncbi:uncharacterized protein LOC125313720 [Rhodamnia argentea]|uniref:Uncharacterized protein LOC125313720 n=1 Tax=Rhodamnia argentea TaxID=178133 RepID=A0ABM3GYZ5_9MYRT|nr:uncharacterized protein LOC125313720 [Rhodamnia argentea]
MDNLRKPQSAKCKAEPNDNPMYDVLDTPFIFRRWSESISACNLLSEFLKESPRKLHKHDQSWGNTGFSNICIFPWRMVEKIISCFHQASETITGLGGPRETFKIANTRYVSKNPFIQDLWIFIFKEVRRKSEYAFDETKAREIYEGRGDLFLTYRLGDADGNNLLRYVNQARYDSSILCWHIATEIWYNMEKATERNERREFGKILSDYMLYLLLNQHDMVSGVAGAAQMTLADMVLDLSDHIGDATKDTAELCKRLYDYPSHKFGISTLNEGLGLARQMASLGEKKWEVMSGVWVEMLSYAASHIKGDAHVRGLSKGGELLAFVWLLMAHFGCFYKPPWGIFYKPLDARFVHPTGFR